jgi:hypothetical protein
VTELRASDVDRERTVAALRHHAAVGRLSVDELSERSERAYAATTLRELTMAELIAHLAPAIQERGFDLIQRADDRLRFERRRRPGWTFAVAVLVPIFGWFALLHKDRVRITVDVAETDRGTQLVASGVAPLAIRRAFAELEH